MRLIFSFLGMSLSQQDLGRWQGTTAVAMQNRYPLSSQAGSCLQKEKEKFKMGEFISI